MYSSADKIFLDTKYCETFDYQTCVKDVTGFFPCTLVTLAIGGVQTYIGEPACSTSQGVCEWYQTSFGKLFADVFRFCKLKLNYKYFSISTKFYYFLWQ